MNYHKIKHNDIANGEGVRVSLWVSGCNRHCPGCFNSELWDFNSGKPFGADQLQEIWREIARPEISGLTILGGEPLDMPNASDLIWLVCCTKAAFPDKTIWIYTGHDFDEVKNYPIVRFCDVLVDGSFIEDLKDPSLIFKGSSNQRIIDIPATFKTGTIQLWRANNEKE